MTGKEKIDYMKGSERLKKLNVYFNHCSNAEYKHLKNTLTTYEWDLPTDKNVSKNIRLIFECLENRPSFFPITDKLFNMFNGIKKYVKDYKRIIIGKPLSLFIFAIDLGYVEGFYIFSCQYTSLWSFIINKNDYIKLGVFLKGVM
jgi:hypothetical protein